MTDERSPVWLCLRDDDVCRHSAVPLLARLRAEVWRSRPVTAAVIPRVGSANCSERTPFGTEGVIERNFRENASLVEHLHHEIAAGTGEVAVHGVTHLDHAGPERMSAEFEVSAGAMIGRLLGECNALRRQFGTSFFVPPHNAAHPDVLAACLDAGFDVCRSMTREEVHQVAGSDRRDQAKALQPYRWSGAALEVFQTILLSKERIVRNGWPAEEVARGVVAIAERAGMAVITLHWWDFTTDGAEAWDPSYAQWMKRFLAAVESQVAALGRTPVYCTLSALAATLRSERAHVHNVVLPAVRNAEGSGVS